MGSNTSLIFNDENGLIHIKTIMASLEKYRGFQLLTRREMIENSGNLEPLIGLCGDFVNDVYVRERLTQCFVLENKKFDALFILNTQIQIVHGFIIVEMGEISQCNPQIFSNVWSVNTICSVPGKGKILLGTFLYCLNNSLKRQGAPPEYQFAILELAGNYENISGFMLYTNMGFQVDLSLYDGPPYNTNKCFKELDTLPMKADLSTRHSEELLQNIFANRDLSSSVIDSTELYNLYKSKRPIDQEKKEQEEMCNQLATEMIKEIKQQKHDPELLRRFNECKGKYASLFPDDMEINYGEWEEEM